MDVREMYNFVNKVDPNSELPGYKIKAHRFDYQRKIRNKKLFEIATFKRKRGYMGGRKLPSDKKWTHNIAKKSNLTPGPWKYDKKDHWITGPKAKSIEPYLVDETKDQFN